MYAERVNRRVSQSVVVPHLVPLQLVELDQIYFLL